MTTDTGDVAVTRQFDAVVVGAGVSGLDALHHLRERGFTAHVIEAGDGVGGLPAYIDRCDAVVAAGYEGFAFS